LKMFSSQTNRLHPPTHVLATNNPVHTTPSYHSPKLLFDLKLKKDAEIYPSMVLAHPLIQPKSSCISISNFSRHLKTNWIEFKFEPIEQISLQQFDANHGIQSTPKLTFLSTSSPYLILMTSFHKLFSSPINLHHHFARRLIFINLTSPPQGHLHS
jgi:hypothetical protein